MTTTTAAQPTSAPSRMATTRRAALHYLEMSAAMGAGMILFVPPIQWGLAAAGWSNAAERADVRAMIMATAMAVAMAGWMLIRRHGRAEVTEMTAAMYLPFVALLLPYRVGALSGDGLMVLGHVLMMSAMAVVVYRHRHHHTRRH
ncbi:hypothetical protein ABZV91_18520 [Nocardia sp. NPDC004568]|uniref:hypothetical protein n=1 Tax=Nocardia sp. NPDC004568 TaxID=3154551 RepID=UPI0033B5B899